MTTIHFLSMPAGASSRSLFDYIASSCAWVYGYTMQKIKVEHHSLSGGLWLLGWLFTIGFLKLTFGKGVLAILVWPYYLGVALNSLVPGSG